MNHTLKTLNLKDINANTPAVKHLLRYYGLVVRYTKTSLFMSICPYVANELLEIEFNSSVFEELDDVYNATINYFYTIVSSTND